jgi:hypothetical protein
MMWLRLGILAGAIALCACKPAGLVGEHPPEETAEPQAAGSAELAEHGPAIGVLSNANPDGQKPLSAKRIASASAPQASAPQESPRMIGGDVVPPVRLKGVKIPFSQRDCRWMGPIIIETVIDTQGQIERPRFLKEQPPACIEQPIRDSLSTWQFRPAELHGEPVSVYYMLTVNIHWQ